MMEQYYGKQAIIVARSPYGENPAGEHHFDIGERVTLHDPEKDPTDWYWESDVEIVGYNGDTSQALVEGDFRILAEEEVTKEVTPRENNTDISDLMTLFGHLKQGTIVDSESNDLMKFLVKSGAISTFVPDLGQEYWTYSKITGLTAPEKWKASITDRQLLYDFRVFQTQNEAYRAAKSEVQERG